ncbi:hypothetical protein Tco_0152077 [Tanacetum coccineum]
MKDEHLDTIPATESDEVIKSSVENLVQIPSESKGISDGVCDVLLCDNPTPLEAFKEHSETIIDFNDDSTSSDGDSPYGEDINYVDGSVLPMLRYDILREKLLNVNLLIANIKALKDNPTPSSDFVTKFVVAVTLCVLICLFRFMKLSYSDDDQIKEKSSGSIRNGRVGRFTMDCGGGIFSNNENKSHVTNVLPPSTLHWIWIARILKTLVFMVLSIRASYPQLHLGNPIF